MTALSRRPMININIVPPEILTEIFQLTVLLKDPRQTQYYDTTSTPWLTSQVCHKWRRISHSSSKLWSTVTLTKLLLKMPAFFNAANPPQQIRRLRYLLEKRVQYSNASPLSIHVDIQMQGFGGAAVVLMALETLLPALRRWRDFEWVIDGVQVLDPLPGLTDCTTAPLEYKILRRLNLDFSDVNSMGASEVMGNLQRTPHLQSLRIVQPPSFHEATPSVTYDWDQVRDLSLERFQSADLGPTLKMMKNVEAIQLMTPCGDRFEIPDGFTLPHLTSLSLGGTLGQWHLLLKHLRAPSLRNLTIFVYRPHERDLEPLLTFVRSSGTSLRTFICHQPFSVESAGVFPHVLREVPNLEHLQVHYASPDIFRALLSLLLISTASTVDSTRGHQDKEKAAPGSLCPRLSTLTIASSGKRSSSPSKVGDSDPPILDLVAGVLESRWYALEADTQKRLAFTRVVVSDIDGTVPVDDIVAFRKSLETPVVKSAIARLQKLAYEGMDIDVRWPRASLAPNLYPSFIFPESWIASS